MKTLRLFIPLLIISFNVFGNLSIYNPKLCISEIYIESPDSWLIELGFSYDTAGIKIDSIAIETKAWMSKVINDSLFDAGSSGYPFEFLCVISNNNLERNLEIIRENDFVKVYTYVDGNSYTDSLSFGQFPGSFFPIFKEGYSIALSPSWLLSLDNSPSIGEINTDEGMLGTVEGYVYNKNHEPIANTTIGFGSYILTDENGYYTTNILSRIYYTDTIWTSTTETYIFKPDTIDVQPDSTLQKDLIVISHSLHSSIFNQTYSPGDLIMNYPNPFKDLTTFIVRLSDFFDNKVVDLQIYNNMGQTVGSFRLPNKRSAIALPSDMIGSLKAGTYYYKIIIDGVPTGETKTMVKIP